METLKRPVPEISGKKKELLINGTMTIVSVGRKGYHLISCIKKSIHVEQGKAKIVKKNIQEDTVCDIQVKKNF